jgi:large subunit ribosomal protein L3
MIGHFKKANVPPKRVVKEFPVTADAHVPVGASLDIYNPKFAWIYVGVGATLSAAHFVPGQFVDVVANS